MKIDSKFPIDSHVKVVEIYIDENIYRKEDLEVGEKITGLQRKNILRLKGCVGTVSGYDKVYGMNSHEVVVVDFGTEGEYCMFSPFELELTEDEPFVTPEFEEMIDYSPLSPEEVALAEKLYILRFDKHTKEELQNKMYSATYCEELASEAIMAARLFHKNANMEWECGTKFVQKKNRT